jgi:hypothetical protein
LRSTSRSASSDSVEKGLVISQSPTGTATKGATITITVSTGSETVSVPSVVGMDKDTAQSTLANAGFKYDPQYRYDDSTPVNQVISQSPTGKRQEGRHDHAGHLERPAEQQHDGRRELGHLFFHRDQHDLGHQRHVGKQHHERQLGSSPPAFALSLVRGTSSRGPSHFLTQHVPSLTQAWGITRRSVSAASTRSCRRDFTFIEAVKPLVIEVTARSFARFGQ